jgi:hypothetical protein
MTKTTKSGDTFECPFRMRVDQFDPPSPKPFCSERRAEAMLKFSMVPPTALSSGHDGLLRISGGLEFPIPSPLSIHRADWSTVSIVEPDEVHQPVEVTSDPHLGDIMCRQKEASSVIVPSIGEGVGKIGD